MSNHADETQFSFKATKDGKLLVFWEGKHVRTYKGAQAARVIDEIISAESGDDVQFALARVTGNFKRGNERKGRSFIESFLQFRS